MTSFKWTQDPAIQASILAELTGQGCLGDAPASITPLGAGGKFTPEGTVQPFPGNTFLCHIDQGSEVYRGLCRVQDDLRGSQWADHFAFLEQPSLHMTIFCGVSGRPLGCDGWPAGIAREATLAQVNQRFLEKLSGCTDDFCVRMRATGLRPHSIFMAGARPEDVQTLHDARANLRERTGLSRHNHDTYRFHVSLGYLIKWMDRDWAQKLLVQSEASYARHLHGCAATTFRQIEFCTFADMQGFEVLTRFG